MNKRKRYLKKSADGRFFLFVEKPNYSPIDMHKKTALWTSSKFLVEESIKENPELALSQIEEMIDWNRKNERYEFCSKLLDLKKNFF